MLDAKVDDQLRIEDATRVGPDDQIWVQVGDRWKISGGQVSQFKFRLKGIFSIPGAI